MISVTIEFFAGALSRKRQKRGAKLLLHSAARSIISLSPSTRFREGPRRRPVTRHWPRMIGLSCLLLAAAGCANFWDELLSQERDWNYVWGFHKPSPLLVIRDNLDGK